MMLRKSLFANRGFMLHYLFFIFTFFVRFEFFNSNCGHNKFGKAQTEFVDVAYSQKDNWQPMRIIADYTLLSTVESPEAVSFANIIEKEIMPKTIKIIEQLFKVRRIDSFTLENEKCGKRTIIPNHLINVPLQTDLLIIVLFDTTGKYKANRVEASAVHCFQDKLTKRSIVGKITFRDDLIPQSSVDVDYMIWLTLHEISHVLLFNKSLYKFFIDQDYNLVGINNVLYEIANDKGQKIFNVSTKKVVEVAKKHFNCPGITGVPLEYNVQGEKSAISGHWSRKAMNTDYMIGRSHGENLISEITLAFFEDSGWYVPNYSKANIFFWGKNEGCNFIHGNCVKKSLSNQNLTKITVRTNFPKEFCQYMNQPTCSIHHQFRGFCGIKVFNKELPFEHINFDNPRVGGYDTFVNRCPLVIEMKYNQKFYGGNCKFGSNEGISNLEKICPECACFLSSLRKKPTEDIEEIDKIHSYPIEKYLKASCYEYKCINGNIKVMIEGKEYQCPSKKKIHIKGYYGRIYCPDKDIICNQKYNCNFGCTDV